MRYLPDDEQRQLKIARLKKIAEEKLAAEKDRRKENRERVLAANGVVRVRAVARS